MGKYLDLCIHGSEISELRERRPPTVIEDSDIPLAPARPNLPGVSPEFAARLSAEDLEDIASGDMSVELVRAFEQAAIARETGFHAQSQRRAATNEAESTSIS